MKDLMPASINGIEMDVLADVNNQYTQDIPEYPVEDGYSVSDTIILRPVVLNVVAYIGNLPVTWKSRHGVSSGRTEQVKSELENLYFSKALVTVEMTGRSYSNMGITSMTISKINNSYYEVSLSMKEVNVTQRKTTDIPSYSLKSGKSESNAGKASTSASSGGSGGSSSSKSSSSSTKSEKKGSILYGAASGLGFL